MRGKMAAPVTVWAAGQGRRASGLTVSSMLIADGDPAFVLGLVDEDSDFWDDEPDVFMVNLLAPGHEFMADAFAGTAPAPGGPFTLATWTDTPWGPRLADASGWLGVRRVPGEPQHVGWGLLIQAQIEHIEVGEATSLMHVRGRYSEATKSG